MRIRLLTTALAATGLLAMGVAYFSLTPFPLAGLQVTTDVCEDASVEDTVVRSSWSGAIYSVAIVEPENCGFALHDVSVQRLGSDLFVRTRYRSPDGLSTACHCDHRTRLGIPGLPRQAYRVHVYSWP